MIGEIEFEKLVWGQILGLQSLFHMPSSVQYVRDRLPSCGYGTSSLTWRRQGPHPHTYRLPRSCWVNRAGRPQRRGCLGGAPQGRWCSCGEYSLSYFLLQHRWQRFKDLTYEEQEETLSQEWDNHPRRPVYLSLLWLHWQS